MRSNGKTEKNVGDGSDQIELDLTSWVQDNAYYGDGEVI